jgi:FkbH-like protein
VIELKYSEILRNNAALAKTLPADTYAVALLSNVTVLQLKDVLEYSLRSSGIPAVVTVGDYDNIVQDSAKFRESQAVVVFWEPCNFIDGLQYKIELYEPREVDAVLDKIKAEIDFVFANVAKTSLVLFNEFTAIPFSRAGDGNRTKLEELCARLNAYLRERAPRNVKIVDLERVIARTGAGAAVDMRYFYSSKALYSVDFYKRYAEHVKSYLRSANGKAKKVIVFDCDNTLWKGVLGEEGFDGIEMSTETKDGGIFAEVQSIALALNAAGVLICLCSKNNPADVDNVLESHPSMQIRERHVAARRVNWADKASNLRELARELNVGLDSFVMVDDSSFEANLIREQLPEVTMLQVPARLHEYPQMLRDNSGLFYNLSSTREDANKAEMYKEQSLRDADRESFADIDSYLASLGMKLTIYRNDPSIVPRMAQLTQKTNQFNLTTKRYTEQDILAFIDDGRSAVFAFGVSDKFGDSGITGLCIVKVDEAHAVIDSFLMSCRIIGRNIEYAFMDTLVSYLNERDVSSVAAQYLETAKNGQVREFFDRCSFSLDRATAGERGYSLRTADYAPRQIGYVEISNGRPN